ncbi:hypothetical protein R1sor_000177 [Riccia sorocarpa]|uniref:RING-type domain-containing protein n=1 Tax=Riccia sorocarpa TaxID=122646 RepID=A0ABD3GSC9_9MARC
MPGDIPKTLVLDEDIEKCFGPRSGNKGRNGPKLNNCTELPQSEVLHLFQVIDGHDKPVNGTLGAIFPRALYAERFLKKRINWAEYAQERHRNQLRSSKSRRESKPIGPPILRVHRVYKPPPSLSLEPGETDERAPIASPDMNLLQSLEAEEEDLNLSLSGVLTIIEECSARLLQSQTEMKLSRSKQEELKMELERVELKVDNAQVVLRREEALLAFQKEELRCLQPFVESSVAPLIPIWIPTATEVTKTIFRLSSCPVCCLGFHCMNFMPTSCGHAYHPACLAAVIAHSGQ